MPGLLYCLSLWLIPTLPTCCRRVAHSPFDADLDCLEALSCAYEDRLRPEGAPDFRWDTEAGLKAQAASALRMRQSMGARAPLQVCAVCARYVAWHTDDGRPGFSMCPFDQLPHSDTLRADGVKVPGYIPRDALTTVTYLRLDSKAQPPTLRPVKYCLEPAGTVWTFPSNPSNIPTAHL